MDFLFGLDKVSAHDDDLALLTTTHDPVELSILRSILETEEIPYLVRDRGCGASVRVIAGYSTVGSDLFVPKELAEQAKALLEEYRNAEIADENPENENENPEGDSETEEP